ncbi:MAG: penicillin acylase family protein [Geminicoccaceae bacterium]
MRWLKRILAALLVLTAAGTLFLYLLFRASLPVVDGIIELDGLEQAVVIERDGRGIPHIHAGSERDAYFAVGFVHAQDRLWQLEMHRRAAAGRMAEILGSQALGIDPVHARSVSIAGPNDRRPFSRSANTSICCRPIPTGSTPFSPAVAAQLPPEFQLLWHEPEPWTVTDSLVWPRMMALDLSKNWADEAMRARLAQRFDEEASPTWMPGSTEDDLPSIRGDIDKAANAIERVLALAGDHDTTGLGSNIFRRCRRGQRQRRGDPRQRSAPAPRQSVHLVHGADQDAGTRCHRCHHPGHAVCRHRAKRGHFVGFTASGADAGSVIETVDPADDGRYLTETGSETFGIIEERIAVRFGEPEKLTVRSTGNGPVLSDIGAAPAAGDERVIALRWTALDDDDRTIKAGFGLARARNWEEFRAALGDFHAPPMNVAYADRSGRVALSLVGRVPVRTGGDGRFPVDGRKTGPVWSGYLADSELPRIVDPPSGKVVNANNAIVGPSYPHHLTTDWDPDLRARRLEKLLSVPFPGRDELIAAQNDAHSTLADDFLPLLLRARTDSPRQAELVARLRGWNRRMDRDSPEPLIFAAWYRALVEAVLADELQADFARFEGIRSRTLQRIVTKAPRWCGDSRTADITETCVERAGFALVRADADLTSRFGADVDGWSWGAAQPVVMKHAPLDRIPLIRKLFSIETTKNGDSSSPDVASHDRSMPFEIVAAASMRILIDWSKPAQMLVVNATGQSGHPLSRHHDDMTPLWRSGEFSVVQMGDVPSPTGSKHRLEISPKTTGMDGVK